MNTKNAVCIGKKAGNVTATIIGAFFGLLAGAVPGGDKIARGTAIVTGLCVQLVVTGLCLLIGWAVRQLRKQPARVTGATP